MAPLCSLYARRQRHDEGHERVLEAGASLRRNYNRAKKTLERPTGCDRVYPVRNPAP